jgi:hypothetical protein
VIPISKRQQERNKLGSWYFGDDLEDMKELLESISAALHDAERRSAKERSVQLWLKRLKHAASEISDLLDDYHDTSSDRLTAKVGMYLSSITLIASIFD